MRRPEPWHRKQNDSWYVCLNGTQVPLDVKGLDNKDAAYEAFYKLMATEGLMPPAEEPDDRRARREVPRVVEDRARGNDAGVL